MKKVIAALMITIITVGCVSAMDAECHNPLAILKPKKMIMALAIKTVISSNQIQPANADIINFATEGNITQWQPNVLNKNDTILNYNYNEKANKTYFLVNHTDPYQDIYLYFPENEIKNVNLTNLQTSETLYPDYRKDLNASFFRNLGQANTQQDNANGNNWGVKDLFGGWLGSLVIGVGSAIPTGWVTYNFTEYKTESFWSKVSRTCCCKRKPPIIQHNHNPRGIGNKIVVALEEEEKK